MGNLLIRLHKEGLPAVKISSCIQREKIPSHGVTRLGVVARMREDWIVQKPSLSQSNKVRSCFHKSASELSTQSSCGRMLFPQSGAAWRDWGLSLGLGQVEAVALPAGGVLWLCCVAKQTSCKRGTVCAATEKMKTRLMGSSERPCWVKSLNS